jgi:hypothetical protein
MEHIVFARCADSVAQGRRLENLSWRLWNRETFCCESTDELSANSPTGTQPRDIHPKQTLMTLSDDMPQLSGSVESIADEEAVEFTAESAPVDIVRPRIRRQDSCASSRSRGRERHISSDYLEKMVASIIEAKEPLTAPLPNISYSSPLPRAEKSVSPSELERSGSTTTESPCKTSETPSMESLQPASSPEMSSSHSHTTIIRGFSPSHPSMKSIPAQTTKTPSLSVIPDPEEGPAPKLVQPKKLQAKFALGGSSGSGDDSYSNSGHSLEIRKQPIPQPSKKKIFQVGGSSDEDGSLKSALHIPKPSLLTAQKKSASFNRHPVTGTLQGLRTISDNEQSETDYMDESAIDDDDDDEWEDSIEDSGKSSMEEKISFHRVDSRANLTSRRSLLTLMLAHNERPQLLGNNASQSTTAISRGRPPLNRSSIVASPNDSDDGPLMMKRASRAPPMRSINEIPRSTAQPIMAPSNIPHHHLQAALSPRTTRRNMLATELTESLRRHLLWERSQKTSVANAVLKRRHTSHDVANLKQYPEKPFMKKENDVNATSWDQYFNKDSFTGYHAQGW